MEEKELTVEEAIAQTERIGLGDLVIAGLIAALVVVAQIFWEFPGLHPSVWGDAVVAAGVRPAVQVIPGYCSALMTIVYAFAGIADGEIVLRFFGHLLLGGVSACVYMLLREWLAFSMRLRPQLSRRRTSVMRLAAAIGAVAFPCADPVWAAGQCLSETAILLFLSLVSLKWFFSFLRKGLISRAYFCALFLGLLAADHPMGLVLPILFIALTAFISKIMPSLESPLFKPAVMEVGKWHITFIYIFALVAGVALNSCMYNFHQGTSAIGESIGAIPLAYLLQYWGLVAHSGSAASWVLWIGVCLLPFVVTILRFPASSDEDRFLPYGAGLIIFFCGLIAFSQFTFLSALWFWKHVPMESQYLLSLGLFCSASVLASGITVLGVDAFCRNHQRLAKQLFGEETEDEDIQLRRPVASGLSKLFRRFCMFTIPVFLLVMMIPSRVKTTTREMLALIQDAIHEIVEENEGARYLFTDGNLDTAIELEGARRGTVINCYSLMGGNGAMATYLRTRDLGKDEEDIFSFRYDTAMGMRTWIRDKPERLKNCSALMGFDLWKRDGRPIPPMGGMLARPMGFKSEMVQLEGVKRARALVERMLKIYSRVGGIGVCTDTAIVSAFQILQWRLARMCVYRGEAYDLQGKADDAIYEAGLAKMLNDRNMLYKDLVRSMERRSAAMMQKLTPREGLQLALVRADFTMGKLYSETILSNDPDNPDANFAMGMFYLGEHQLTRAATYLKRCLIRKPNEPAVYNNLAMIQIELKRYEAARANIKKALAIIPNSSAVLDTEKALEAAIKADREPKKKKLPKAE